MAPARRTRSNAMQCLAALLLVAVTIGCTESSLKPITWLQHPPRAHRSAATPCGGNFDAAEAGAENGGDGETGGECDSDSDCSGGKPCGCGLACSSDGGAHNVCLSGSNCNTDSNCPTESPFCSYSEAPSQECNAANGEFATGYFCHTAKDSCADDGDCAGATRCLYHRASQRWTCG